MRTSSSSLGSLDELKLQDNDLASLSEHIFDGMTLLDHLDLSGNALTSLHADIFKGDATDGGPAGLAYVDLSENSLSAGTLDVNLFKPMADLASTDLKFLGLRGMSLSSLPEDIFKGLDTLRRLDLSCNSFPSMNATQATAFANRFEGPKDSLRVVDLSGASWTSQTVRDRVKAAVEAKLTNEWHVEALYKGPLGAAWGPGGATCDSSLFDDTLLEVRSSAGTVEFNELNQTWDVTVAADVDHLTITPVPAHPTHGSRSTAQRELTEFYTDESAAHDAEYYYYDLEFVANYLLTDFRRRPGIQLNLREGGWHQVDLGATFSNGDLVNAFDTVDVRVYREPPRLRRPCWPGRVSLNTVYSDGDGRPGGRPGNLFPGLHSFDGPRREWIVPAWANAQKQHCVARTELWRADSATNRPELVKAWNGAPRAGGGKAEGGWRDNETRLAHAYQYTIRRFGTDGSFSEAKTKWIPVLPFYLDGDASFRDARRDDGSLRPANEVKYYMKIQVGLENGEVITNAGAVPAGEIVTGLYTYEFCVGKYPVLRCTFEGENRLGIKGIRNCADFVHDGTDKGKPRSINFVDGSNVGSYVGFDAGHLCVAADRSTMVCYRLEHTNSATLKVTPFYDGCAVYDVVWSRHITRETDDPALLRSGVAVPRPENVAASVSLAPQGPQVLLSWDEVESDPSNGIAVADYQVLRRGPGESEFSVLGTTGGAVRFTDTDVARGSDYVYVVKTVTADRGLSRPSDEAPVSVPPVPPAAPTSFEADVGEDSVTLSWDAPDEGIVTGYIVDRKLRNAGPSQQAVLVGHVGGDVTQVTDSNPVAGAAYRYSITAINTGGRSKPATVKVDIPEPDNGMAAPTGLTATRSGLTVNLAWDAVEGATGYDVLRQGPDETAYFKLATPTANSYSDSPPSSGTYSYKVRAADDDGVGTLTDAVSADIPAPPDAPTSLQATATSSSVTLSWTAPAQTIVTYLVTRKVRDADPPEDFEPLGVTAGATTTYTDTTVEAGTAYAYQVGAVGIELSSEPATVEVDTPPVLQQGLPGEKLLQPTLDPDKSVVPQVMASEISICGRDPAVVKAIKFALDDNDFSCSAVDEDDLDDIESLGVQGYGRFSIMPADLAGLDALTELRIVDSPALKALPTLAFSEVPKLENLVLSGNSIRWIESGAFANLPDLVKLDLGRNALRGVQPGLFVGAVFDEDGNHVGELEMENLDTLVLADNLISELNSEMFIGLRGLLHLQVGGNQIAALDDGRLFHPFGELETFDATDNRIESIAPFVFSPVQSTLQEIHLSGNELSRLNGLEFAGYLREAMAPLAALTELSLADNGLESVRSYPPTQPPPGWDAVAWDDVWTGFSTTPSWGEWDTFSQLPKLVTLDLSRNNLEESDLSRALFEPLDKLAGLYLSRNPLADSNGQIGADLFDGMAALSGSGTFTLNLGGTGLTSLDNDPFDGYTGLESLDLAGNGLTSLASLPFQGLSGLGNQDGYVSLAGNGLTSVPANLFEDAHAALESVQLQDNELSSVPANLFDGRTNLSAVNLSGNNLTSLPASLFDGLGELFVLELDDNELASLNVDLFDGLGNLKTLSLAGNRLTTLPEDIFKGDDSDPPVGPFDMKFLDLSENLISSLPVDVFDPLGGELRFLGLRSNQLPDSLSADIFDGLAGLSRLDLACNSFTAPDAASATSFAARFEETTNLDFVDVSGTSYGSQTALNRVKTAVNAKRPGILHIEASFNTACEYSLFEDPLAEVRSSAGWVEYDELNDRWDIYVGADVDQVTITPVAAHHRQKVRGRDQIDINAPRIDLPSSLVIEYAYHDADTNRPGIQVKLRDGGWHRVWTGATFASDHLVEDFDHERVRVYREPPPMRREGCAPGAVSLNTVYSDGDGLEGGRKGNLFPGLHSFDGPLREWIVLGWAKVDKPQCVARTELWRGDGQYQTERLVKEWNGVPPSDDHAEGRWRDTETVIGTAFQYTIRRFGTDESFSQASTEWIPVMPAYLDLDKSWQDAYNDDGSLIHANDVVYNARLQLGAPENGEVLMMAPSLLNEGERPVIGLYTWEFCRMQYSTPVFTCGEIDVVSINAVSYLRVTPPQTAGPLKRTFTPSASVIAMTNANRFANWCVKLKFTDHTDIEVEHSIYDGCAAFDLMPARHITKTNNPPAAESGALAPWPENVAASVLLSSEGARVVLRWDEVESDPRNEIAVTDYQVLRRGAGESEFSVLGTTGGTTAFTDSDVAYGSDYSYVVKTVTADSGLSWPSEEASVSVPAAPPETPAAGPLDGFRLVDAADQSLISLLADGDTVELDSPDAGSFAIEATIVDGESVGSVSFELTGPVSYGPKTESHAPYSLHGDTKSGSDIELHGQALPAGEYTLTATAWSQRGLSGDELGTLEISFTVTENPDAPEPPDTGSLAGFRLVDAADQSLIATLADGGTVALDSPSTGSFAIEATIVDGHSVGSVSFELAGPVSYGPVVESYAPYSLHGDTYSGSDIELLGQPLPPGDYTLTATAWSLRRLTGDEVGTFEISFTITAAD